VAHVVYAAWEDEIVQRASTAVKRGQKSLAWFGHKFELHGPLGLQLHHRAPISNRAARHDVADLHFDDVATTQFAVDHQIRQCPVAQSSMFIEKETNCTCDAGFEWTFCADYITSVPRTASVSVGIKIRYSYDTTPSARMALTILRFWLKTVLTPLCQIRRWS
jgi:hypothetical protein